MADSGETTRSAAPLGLGRLHPEEAQRLAAMGARVAAQVASITRPLPKEVEPAHTFRVARPNISPAQRDGLLP